MTRGAIRSYRSMWPTKTLMRLSYAYQIHRPAQNVALQVWLTTFTCIGRAAAPPVVIRPLPFCIHASPSRTPEPTDGQKTPTAAQPSLVSFGCSGKPPSNRIESAFLKKKKKLCFLAAQRTCARSTFAPSLHQPATSLSGSGMGQTTRGRTAPQWKAPGRRQGLMHSRPLGGIVRTTTHRRIMQLQSNGPPPPRAVARALHTGAVHPPPPPAHTAVRWGPPGDAQVLPALARRRHRRAGLGRFCRDVQV